MKEKTLIVLIIFLLLLFIIGIGYKYNKENAPPKKAFSFEQTGETVGSAATDFTIGVGKGMYKNIKEKVKK